MSSRPPLVRDGDRFRPFMDSGLSTFRDDKLWLLLLSFIVVDNVKELIWISRCSIKPWTYCKLNMRCRLSRFLV